MRCSSVQLVGPAGGSMVLEATGQGEIIIDPHPELGTLLIRDTGMPPYPPSEQRTKHGTQKIPAQPRIVAQLPIGHWAVFPTWEITGKVPFEPTNPMG